MSSEHACQANPDQWFSDKPKDRLVAKAACRKCPTRQRCEEAGWDQEHGIWGGLSARDRKKLDPKRYAEAQAGARRRSEERDQAIEDLREKADGDAEDMLNPGLPETAQGPWMV